jgi:hypothetical protein
MVSGGTQGRSKNWVRVARCLPVILGCSGAVAGGAWAKGASPLQAAGAGLFIATTSAAILALLLLIRRRPGDAPRSPA